MKADAPTNEFDVEVHVRTTRAQSGDTFTGSWYSYISSAAVKIGDDVLEVSEDGELFISSITNPETGIMHDAAQEFSDEVFSSACYALKKSHMGKHRRVIVYSLDFLDGNIITIRVNTRTGMVYVDIDGHFDNSVGLVGTSQKETLMSRDGLTDLSGYWNTYGEEWQVKDTELKLFRENRAPQHPAGCMYEQKNLRHRNHSHRRLTGLDAISFEDASKACNHSYDQNLKEFCIADVMASGDLDLAQDPFYI